MILTILIAFFSIMALLVMHELGHFVIAKRFGVKVEEFGIGYPPRILGKRFGETLYSLNLLPFGAFVRIAGEEGEETGVERSRSFQGKSFLQKILIILGGVVSFWIIAAILLSIVFWLGAPQAISDDENGSLDNPRVQILAVGSGSPAQAAGMMPGDVVLSITSNDFSVEIKKVKDLQQFSESHKGEEVTVTILRGNQVMNVNLVPRVNPPSGEGVMGVALVRIADKSYSVWEAPIKGITATADLTKGVVMGWGQILGNIFGGKGMPQGAQLMGPLGIGQMVNEAAQVGLSYFLQFIALLSVYLAVFNILPIPALDGGKIVFLVIERIKGSPVNPKVEQNLTAVFFGILLLMMVFVTIQDVIRLF